MLTLSDKEWFTSLKQQAVCCIKHSFHWTHTRPCYKFNILGSRFTCFPFETGFPYLKRQIQGLSRPISIKFKDLTGHGLRHRSRSMLHHRPQVKREASSMCDHFSNVLALIKTNINNTFKHFQWPHVCFEKAFTNFKEFQGPMVTILRVCCKEYNDGTWLA